MVKDKKVSVQEKKQVQIKRLSQELNNEFLRELSELLKKYNKVPSINFVDGPN